MRDDRTPALDLPLPYYDNYLEEDEPRLREALSTLDTVVAGKQAALGFTPENAAHKGVAGGYAALGGDGKVPASQLPSFVEDVIEVANYATLMTMTGETGKIYVLISTEDHGRQFRWAGTSFIELHPSPGTTDDVPEGSTNRYYTSARVLADVPIASPAVAGRVRVGTGLAIDSDGVLYAAAAGGSIMEVQEIVPASNGLSSVTVPGGYVVGTLLVGLNGSFLAPSDFTATDSTTIGFVGFTVGTTDSIVVAKLSTVAISYLPAGTVGPTQLAAGAAVANIGYTPVNKAGDTMAGLLKLAKGNNIASAATVNLSVATGNTVHITGTTAISAFTLSSGQVMDLIFDGVLTLTHNATTNNLPGSANITTAAGDRARYFYDGTKVYCLSYERADGGPIRRYVSDERTPSVGGTLTFAHGLGYKPRVVRVIRKCVSADGIFSPGDEMELPPDVTYLGHGFGCFALSDNTNVVLKFGYDAVFCVLSGGTSIAATPAKWVVRVEAF